MFSSFQRLSKNVAGGFFNFVWDVFVGFATIRNGRQQARHFDLVIAGAGVTAAQVEHVRVSLQEVLSGGAGIEFNFFFHRRFIKQSLFLISPDISAEAHVFDVIVVALAFAHEIVPRLASDGGESLRISHSELVEVPRASVIAGVRCKVHGLRNSVDVTSGMLRSAVGEEIDLTHAMFHSQNAAVCVNNLDVSAVGSRDSTESFDVHIFEARACVLELKYFNGFSLTQFSFFEQLTSWV